MSDKKLVIKHESYRGEPALAVKGIGDYSLADTLECGQAFRYQQTVAEGDYIEYLTVIGKLLVRVGERERGELLFYGIDEPALNETVIPYFTLNRDYGKIKADICARTNSEWLKTAADYSSGIAILKQDAWEALFSFIISQNNNIPRIRKIIASICREYGENLAEGKYSACPLCRHGEKPSSKSCRDCGICYSFPSPRDIVERPEGLLPSKPGFRYKYLLAAADAVLSGEVDLKKIEEAKSYSVTVEELKKIKGVGDKVASCVALFGFAHLEAFPIDVWMKRAINDYFGGHLDPKTLGDYAGIAQQYIFHYIRNFENK
ncbi:MAG: DNA-3-methyladenine glycosylase 2 [Clostridia bacterium]|nr:DNA-3-methyladenine glycosylase 2 [Clostridia bacterium]